MRANATGALIRVANLSNYRLDLIKRKRMGPEELHQGILRIELLASLEHVYKLLNTPCTCFRLFGSLDPK